MLACRQPPQYSNAGLEFGAVLPHIEHVRFLRTAKKKQAILAWKTRFFSQQRYTGAQGEHLGEREGQKDPATQLA